MIKLKFDYLLLQAVFMFHLLNPMSVGLNEIFANTKLLHN